MILFWFRFRSVRWTRFSIPSIDVSRLKLASRTSRLTSKSRHSSLSIALLLMSSFVSRLKSARLLTVQMFLLLRFRLRMSLKSSSVNSRRGSCSRSDWIIRSVVIIAYLY